GRHGHRVRRVRLGLGRALVLPRRLRAPRRRGDRLARAPASARGGARSRRPEVIPDFDYSRFFTLEEAFERSALRVNVVDPPHVDPWEVTRGEAAIQTLRCECDEGSQALDLVGTTLAVLRVLSS